MARRGGLSKINYKETAGIKVAGGQSVKAGAVLTRQGDRWKPGINVIGRTLLNAACDGEVYFTHKTGKYTTPLTIVNVRPITDGKKK